MYDTLEFDNLYMHFTAENLLALSYYSIGKYKDSLDHYKNTYDKLMVLYPDDSNSFIAHCLNNIGLCLLSMSRYDQSLKYFKLSLEMRSYIDEEPFYIADSLGNLGMLLRSTGKYDSALLSLKKSLEIRTTLYGDSPHLSVSHSLCCIGRVLYDKGFYEESLAYCLKSLDILEQTRIIEHNTKESLVLVEIGKAYHALQKNELAKVYYNKALDAVKCCSSYYIDYCLHSLGLIEYEEGNLDEALKYFYNALIILKKRGEKSTIIKSSILNSIGLVCLEKEQYNLALKLFKTSLSIDKFLYKGIFHKEVACTLNNIGKVFFEKEENKLALQYFSQAVNIMRFVFKRSYLLQLDFIKAWACTYKFFRTQNNDFII